MRKRTPVLERMGRLTVIDPDTGCWLWVGGLNPNGYGTVKDENSRTATVHRLTYKQLVGPIPDGLGLDHLCRVRRCRNPEHVEQVTQRKNLERGDTLNARGLTQTHCSRDHELAAANSYRHPDGSRRCRMCNRLRARVIRARNKEMRHH
jgi:hypothetical protein